jgi:hypothetical protein
MRSTLARRRHRLKGFSQIIHAYLFKSVLSVALIGTLQKSSKAKTRLLTINR